MRVDALLRDFSDTVAFVKVAQCGSFTKAAEALRVPKTRISRKVQELEDRLGAQLMIRSTRQLRLTEAGQCYFDECRSAIVALEDAENGLASLEGRTEGWLEITAPHWMGAQLLAPILSDFRKTNPYIHPSLHLCHELVDLIGREIDIAFRIWHGTLPESSLIARRFGKLPTGIYATPDYLAENGTPTHPSELSVHDCLVAQIYMGRDTIAWPLTGPSGEEGRFPVRAIAASSDPDGLYQLLRSGNGLQLTNHIRARDDVEAGTLIRVLPEWSGPSPTLYALRPAGKIQPLKVEKFLDFIQPMLRGMLRPDHT